MGTTIEVNPKRVRELKAGTARSGPVLYWMSRDQRVNDNWALLFAQRLALLRRVPLTVAFSLAPGFLGATIRHYAFMLRGLRALESSLARLEIPFFLLLGDPAQTIPSFVRNINAGVVVTDFSPLRVCRHWKDAVRQAADTTVYEVDSHNIVPCWMASNKREFAAYTIRPKIKRQLFEFLTEIPPLRVHHPKWSSKLPRTDWEATEGSLRVNRSVQEVSWLEPGEEAARKVLGHFIASRLESYAQLRNDPTVQNQSMLSPYLHFGQISAQRVALEVQTVDADTGSKEAFLEELIIRRELAENFCHYEPGYDDFCGFPEWAQKTLNKHRDDPREYLYTEEQFENSETHDELWNAAQLEMVKLGKMHGYVRMYWAKKILEWSPIPEEAQQTAIRLNDKYELDGRDPNGYAGIAWSIGGVHDRAWFERPIFGKIRYMSAAGCARKFDVPAYIKQVDRLAK